jgi:hypothetical protein
MDRGDKCGQADEQGLAHVQVAPSGGEQLGYQGHSDRRLTMLALTVGAALRFNRCCAWRAAGRRQCGPTWWRPKSSTRLRPGRRPSKRALEGVDLGPARPRAQVGPGWIRSSGARL